ncbi:alpha/beta fold hydrolase [Alphaproteobacteria bacterium]|nr:alpha/beta fold hydrolase [Alphaproteobacteria bacterium]
MNKKALKICLTCFASFLILVFVFGPREPVRLGTGYDNIMIGDDIDAYLAMREGQFDDIIDGVEKQVIWAGEANVKTPLSIIYLHGFTASSKEIRPVPDRVAAALGANLYFTRFTGHGREPSALADADVGRWMDDVGEAIKIGKQVGDTVIIMATSTGGTLAAAAALDKAAMKNVVGIIFISPNFAINNRAANLLTSPFARQWVPLVIGTDQQGNPRNDRHARYWMMTYPTTALMPMAAIVAAVDRESYDDVNIPALFYYSRQDQVVVSEKTAAFARSWGGVSKTIIASLTEGDDKFSHIIAGDIVSPNQTESAVDHILAWINELQNR